MSKTTIRVSVVSDVVCPWCYIGKRRLERAVDQLRDKFDFDIEYLPFELNPQIPESGLEQKSYLTDKFGGENRYEQLTKHVTNIASQEGLTFDYERQKVSPNTRRAHRLIQLAKAEGKQLAVVEAFFKAHFTDGIDLSKQENLIAIASDAGVDPQQVENLLNSDEGAAEVEGMERQLQQLGITGVPFYIIDNKYGLSGAQPSEVFVKAFEEAGQGQGAKAKG